MLSLIPSLIQILHSIEFILAICLSILVSSGLAWGFWVRPGLGKTHKQLTELAQALEDSSSTVQALASGSATVEKHSALRAPWEATQSRVIAVGTPGETKPLLLNGVDDVWRSERLLQHHFNLALFEAIPNIAVGVGLLFTFLFLTLALYGATAALAAASGAGTDLVKATSDLLSSAGGKFLSSLAGLAVSLVWTIAARRRLVRLDRAATRVVAAIEKLWPPVGAEAAVMEQLGQLRQMGAQLAAQQLVQTQAQKDQADQLALTEDLLLEAREQTGSLKRFETDLAVSIGNAITNSFGPQMEQMTARLEQSISRLSDRIGSMNEEALRKMMEQFAGAMRENTGKEMESFKTTLTSLSQALEISAHNLQHGVGGAAAALGNATTELNDQLAGASAGLVSSVDAVKELVDHTRGAVKELDSVMWRASELGAQGLVQMNSALEGSRQTIGHLTEAGQRWLGLTDRLEAVSGNLSEVCDGVEEISQGQKAAINSVRAAGPEVVATVGHMKGILEESVGQVAQSMTAVQASMERTSRDLTGVVTSITNGVGEYSRQLGELHHAMDQEMSKAVGKLGTAIQSLDETAGDLTDALHDFDRRA